MKQNKTKQKTFHYTVKQICWKNLVALGQVLLQNLVILFLTHFNNYVQN